MHSTEYAIQQALFAVGTAPTRSKAFASFEENQHLLKDWRILYADECKTGPFPLRRAQFSEKGFVSTLFSGHSLWVLDHDVISSSNTMMFQVGYGTYIDSNAASFIRSLAYREEPKEHLLNFVECFQIHSHLMNYPTLILIFIYGRLRETEHRKR